MVLSELEALEELPLVGEVAPTELKAAVEEELTAYVLGEVVVVEPAERIPGQEVLVRVTLEAEAQIPTACGRPEEVCAASFLAGEALVLILYQASNVSRPWTKVGDCFSGPQ